MTLIRKQAPRREILRGIGRGGAVGIALPFLDCFLDDHGTALASGAPIPVRFGTWYWGMGHTPGHAVAPSTQTKTGITFLEECKALAPHAQHINYFSDFNLPTDGRSNYVHLTGWVGLRTGAAPSRDGEIPATTLDLLIADAIGGTTRFRNLDLTSTGNPADTYTARGTHGRNAAEVSPTAFYARLFGGGPDAMAAGSEKMNTDLMVRQSVLSAVGEQRARLAQSVGASDRARLDQYYTSIRELEGQLAVQSQPREVSEACQVIAPPGMDAPERFALGVEINNVIENHRVLTQILTMALACDQARVFNMVFSDAFSRIRKAGETYTHHVLTHEEQTDPKLGYQPQAFWFNCRGMDGFAAFIDAFLKVKEGAGTLLDNTLIFAASETNYARIHSVDGIPIMTAGSGGGRLRTGMHVVGNGDPVTRVGFTMMQAMGLPLESWGQRSLQTSKAIGEILV